jgi:hypothetical protein
MSNQLNKLLEKLNLKWEDLTEEERKTYNSWASVLSSPSVTIEELKKFIPVQIETLEGQQNRYDNSKDKDLFLKAQLRNLKMINAFILGPEQRKKWLEAHIGQKANQ